MGRLADQDILQGLLDRYRGCVRKETYMAHILNRTVG